MRNDRGELLEACLPGVVAETVGWKTSPQVGEMVLEVDSESRAKEVTHGRMQRSEALRQHAFAVAAKRVDRPGLTPLKVVLKAASIGQLQAVNSELSSLVNSEVGVHVINSTVGNVTKFDVDLASAADALVVGFGVNVPAGVSKQAHLQSVELHTQRVVYNLLEFVKERLGQLLPLAVEYDHQGTAEVAQVFGIRGKKRNSPVTNAAGCRVTMGSLSTKHIVRVVRPDNHQDEDLWEEGEAGISYIHQGSVLEMRHFKEQIDTISSGHECGIQLRDYQEFKVGDELQFYTERHVPRVFEMDSN